MKWQLTGKISEPAGCGRKAIWQRARKQCCLTPSVDIGRGWGCCDMVFVARQLLEKAWEHHILLFALFADLRKAYDSVPGVALWVAGDGEMQC